MKRFKFVFTVIFLAFVLSSCSGKEPNDMSYIVALGIDSGENGKYNITIQYANPAQISGGEEINSEESGVQNITVEAGDIYEAVGIADLHDSKSLLLSHTKVIIFSESAARKGIENMSELFINSEELRPDIYLAVSKNAREYLEEINPATEVNPAKYYKLFFDKDKLTGLPQGTLKTFFTGIETGDYDTLLPMVSSEQEAFTSAVFRGGQMVGILNQDETEFYKFLVKDFAGGFITLQNDDTLKKPVTLKISQRKAPKYDIDKNNRTITVNMRLEGNIYSAPPDYNVNSDAETFKKNCEEYIKTQSEALMKKVITKYKSDIFHLNQYAKSGFLTYGDYERYKNFVDYGGYSIEVKVDFDIKKTGLTQRED